MEPIAATDQLSHSADLTIENIERLRELFPQAVTEDGSGKHVDFDILRELLGGELATGEEKYGLNWHGKRAARRLALTPSTGTLRPAPEDSVDWDTTQNLMIEGDNLEVLKLLQKSYAGKVKMIYIDPPYNTGTDFVYRDDFRDSIGNYQRITGQRDAEGAKLTTNPDASGRFHTDWVNMMYPRLLLARNLLREDGICFISIGEAELPNLVSLCDLVFGGECAIGIACRVAKRSNNKGDHWAPNFDYIVTFAKNRATCPPFSGGANTSAYDQVDLEGPRKGEHYQLVRLYMSTIENQNPEQRFWIDCPDGSKVIPPGSTFPPERPRLGDGIWRWSRQKFEAEKDRIVVRAVRSSNLVDQNKEAAKWNVFTKTYLKDVLEKATSKPNNLIEAFLNQIGSHEMTKYGIPFDYPKPSGLIEFLSDISRTGPDDIVLDFFAGSGSTGEAVMRHNAAASGTSRYILVQLPQRLDFEDAAQKEAATFCQELGRPTSIAELTKERLRRAGKQVAADNPMFHGDLGFRVFKLDTTSIRPWDPSLPITEQRLLGEVDNILPGRTEQDLLYELLLKRGLELTVPIVERTLAGKQVFAVSTGDLIACLAPHIESADVEALAEGIVAWHKELAPPPAVDPNAPLEKPAKFDPPLVVFRDTAFTDDVAKSNLTEILKQHSLTDVRSL